MPPIPDYTVPAYWIDDALAFSAGWARSQHSLDAGKANKDIAGLSTVLLPHKHWLYQSVKSYCLRSLDGKKMHAPLGEDARMNHARTKINTAKDEIAKAQLELEKAASDVEKSNLDSKIKQQTAIFVAAENRLREKTKGSGVEAPGHRPISIRNIRLLKHQTNWNKYAHLRTLMLAKAKSGPQNYNAHQQFNWCAPIADGERDLDKAPLLDPNIGEVLLFSGTARDTVLRFIAAQGFSPQFPKPYNQDDVLKKGATPRYGMLGQGTYFTDSFALAMCYSSCRICSDFECNCRGSSGRKTTRTVTAARVLIGNPKFYMNWFSKYVKKKSDAPFRQITAVKDAEKYAEFLDEEFQTVFAQGMHGASAIYKGGSTCNQFSVRHPAQAYLEFVIDFTIGLDSTPYSEALRAKLMEYKKQTTGLRGVFTRQSDESLSAHAILLYMVNVFEGVIDSKFECPEEGLKQAVKFFLTGQVPSLFKADAWGGLPKLNSNGRFAGLLKGLGG